MELPKRKRNRLKDHDYSEPGSYFVTICTHDRKPVLSRIIINDALDGGITVGDGSPVPNSESREAPVCKLTNLGKAALYYIAQIPIKYPTVSVDEYIIMPNHIHMVLTLSSPRAALPTEGGGTGNPSPTLGNIIGWFKYQTTVQINLLNKSPGAKVFQRSFYDHIIRDGSEYWTLRKCVSENPAEWRRDMLYV